MPRTLNRLKPLTVDKARSVGRYADGGGLYLVVKPGPRKSRAFIYRRGAKMTELGLGSVVDVPMVAARAEAAELRAVLAANGDPKAFRARKRQDKALEDARSITFEAAARNHHERHKAKWHRASYVKSWLRVLEIHAVPKIGNHGVGAIDLAAVKKVIEPIWYDKPRTAHLVRANICPYRPPPGASWPGSRCRSLRSTASSQIPPPSSAKSRVPSWTSLACLRARSAASAKTKPLMVSSWLSMGGCERPAQASRNSCMVT